MRKKLFISSLVILPVLLSGCIVVSSNKTQSPPKECEKTPHTNATIVEIDAVSKLASQSARANIYHAIAERPGLSPQERIHLTKAITTHLASQSDREEVLLVLVNNQQPAVHPAPKQGICVPKEASTEE